MEERKERASVGYEDAVQTDCLRSQCEESMNRRKAKEAAQQEKPRGAMFSGQYGGKKKRR